MGDKSWGINSYANSADYQATRLWAGKEINSDESPVSIMGQQQDFVSNPPSQINILNLLNYLSEAPLSCCVCGNYSKNERRYGSPIYVPRTNSIIDDKELSSSTGIWAWLWLWLCSISRIVYIMHLMCSLLSDDNNLTNTRGDSI